MKKKFKTILKRNDKWLQNNSESPKLYIWILLTTYLPLLPSLQAKFFGSLRITIYNLKYYPHAHEERGREEEQTHSYPKQPA